MTDENSRITEMLVILLTTMAEQQQSKNKSLTKALRAAASQLKKTIETDD